MYTKTQIEFQKLLEEDKLAEVAIKYNIRGFVKDFQRDIINKATWFCIGTVDQDGCPNVSIKAGPPGFVRANKSELFFELASGNGMNLTRGDLYRVSKQRDNDKDNMSLFFVDTQTGRKVRLKGTAKLYLSSNENPNTCVHLRVSYVWENCPRFNCFIDRDAVSKSPVETFYFPLWKRLDIVQAALTPKERLLAMQLGLISAKQWDALITEGGADLEYKY